MKRNPVFAWSARAIVAAVALFCVSLAHGESFTLAQGESLNSRIQDAQVVAAIKIATAMERINLALSKNGRFVSEGVRYGAEVEEVWKGDLTVTETLIRFTVSLQDCYKTLVIDTQYLVLAQMADNGELQIDSCDNFVLRASAPRQYAASSQ